MGELLERDHEMHCARRLVDAALAGTGGVLLVEGDAGIGKTELVRAVSAEATERGLSVLAARGAELERELAFGVVRELLGTAAADRGVFDGAARLARPVLDPGSVAAAGPQELFAVLHGLYWLTADLASAGPVLLVVDDGHWCDIPSLRFLAYLARRLDGVAVALLVTTRPNAEDPQRALLDVLAAEPLAATARPRPLGADGVRTLVSAALGPSDPAFAAACRTATGGNPFLLTELLAELAAAGVTAGRDDVDRIDAVVPRGVQRAVLARLAAIPEPAAQLARAAAVLGDGADARRAARLVGVGDIEVGGAVDALVTARLVEPEITLTFLHPLLRAAVGSTLGPAALAATHRRVALLLAEEGEGGDLLVPHLLGATSTGDAWVVDALLDAARRATARGAPDAAVRYLERALVEPPPPALRHPVLLELGRAAMTAGRPQALDHASAAVAEAPDAVTRGRATLLLARVLFEVGRTADAVRMSQQVIVELDGLEPELTRELEAELLSAAIQDLTTLPVALRWHEERTVDPEPDDRTGCMLLADMALLEVLTCGSRTRAAVLATAALTDGHLYGESGEITLPAALLSLTLCGQERRSIELWDGVLADQRDRGNVRGFVRASAARGYAAFHVGDHDAAIADLRSALELARTEAGLWTIEGFAVAWLVPPLIDVGDLAAAEHELMTVAPRFGAGPLLNVNYLLSARGQLRLAQGRLDDAVTDLQECGRRASLWNVSPPGAFTWQTHLAMALLGRGEPDQAAAQAAEALLRARAWGAPFALSEALRVAGLVTDGAAGTALLEEAVAVAVDAPLQRARALTAQGARLRRAGNRVAARAPLTAALDLALERGATALAGPAHEELLATGARPRRLRTAGAQALTATERRVAGMAAKGLTNREVAQSLFVSEKTIETHLGSTYRKLGITSRTQLAGPLGER